MKLLQIILSYFFVLPCLGQGKLSDMDLIGRVKEVYMSASYPGDTTRNTTIKNAKFEIPDFSRVTIKFDKKGNAVEFFIHDTTLSDPKAIHVYNEKNELSAIEFYNWKNELSDVKYYKYKEGKNTRTEIIYDDSHTAYDSTGYFYFDNRRKVIMLSYGNLVSKEITWYNKARLPLKIEWYYSKDGENKNQAPDLVESYNYTKNGLLIQKIKKSPDKTEILLNEYKSGKKVKSVNRIRHNQDPEIVETIFYDEHENPIESKTIYPEGGISIAISAYEYDLKGNWTKKSMHVKSEVENRAEIIERKITYYE